MNNHSIQFFGALFFFFDLTIFPLTPNFLMYSVGMVACKNCGSSQVDEDGAHGYTICMGCGNVLEDQVRVFVCLFVCLFVRLFVCVPSVWAAETC